MKARSKADNWGNWASGYLAMDFRPTENSIGQIGIANLTGYSLATAYSLASRLCQEILRESRMYGKTEAAFGGNMKKRITLYCNDLISRILGPGSPSQTNFIISRRKLLQDVLLFGGRQTAEILCGK
jgi:hypothetical protein